MQSPRSKFLLATTLSFIAGIVVSGVLTWVAFAQAMAFHLDSEMLEDFTQGIAMVSYFQNGQPEHAEAFMIQHLQDSCETYASLRGEAGYDANRINHQIQLAQETTGLCRGVQNQ